MSSSVPMLMKDKEPRNWAELPSELTSSIMLRLDVVDILENVQKVCTSWRRVTKDPSMWRKIDIHYDGDLGSMPYNLEIMCRHAVDRSQAGLAEIAIWYFCTDDLLNYIADSASNLRRLRLAICSQITDKGVAEAVRKLPFLEELDVSYCRLSGEFLRVLGQSCPNLKTLKLKRCPSVMFFSFEADDFDATEIAESMPELRHLLLVGNKLSNTGLNTILDSCPHLESISIRKCHYINLVGNLENRNSKTFRVLKLLNDSTTEFPFEIPRFENPRLYKCYCGRIQHNIQEINQHLQCFADSDYEWD